MCIACNDTSVVVINFRKSKTHAITDTYCKRKLIFLLAKNCQWIKSISDEENHCKHSVG